MEEIQELLEKRQTYLRIIFNNNSSKDQKKVAKSLLQPIDDRLKYYQKKS